MRYDLIFIITALICLLVGEGLGIYMGIGQDFTLSPAHAHMNLLGWVTLATFGLMHRAYPALSGSRIALPQMVLALLANIAMPIGLGAYLVTNAGEPLLIAGSFGVILATLLFIIMFVRRAALAKAA